MGYRGWFFLVEHQWETQLENSLDNAQYNEADLITIKAPLLLPYVTDTREFQRTDGEINFNGKIYRYVKSKVQNGEYILLCIPDHYKQQLESAKQDFFKYANDLYQGNGAKKSGKAVNNIISEYVHNSIELHINFFDSSRLHFNIHKTPALLSLPHLLPEQPPELAAA